MFLLVFLAHEFITKWFNGFHNLEKLQKIMRGFLCALLTSQFESYNMLNLLATIENMSILSVGCYYNWHLSANDHQFKYGQPICKSIQIHLFIYWQHQPPQQVTFQQQIWTLFLTLTCIRFCTASFFWQFFLFAVVVRIGFNSITPVKYLVDGLFWKMANLNHLYVLLLLLLLIYPWALWILHRHLFFSLLYKIG